MRRRELTKPKALKGKTVVAATKRSSKAEAAEESEPRAVPDAEPVVEESDAAAAAEADGAAAAAAGVEAETEDEREETKSKPKPKKAQPAAAAEVEEEEKERKPHKWHPGVKRRFLIKRAQKSVKLSGTRAGFFRILRSGMMMFNNEQRFQARAVNAMRAVVDDVMQQIFRKALRLLVHVEKGKKTLRQEHLLMAARMVLDPLPGHASLALSSLRAKESFAELNKVFCNN